MNIFLPCVLGVIKRRGPTTRRPGWMWPKEKATTQGRRGKNRRRGDCDIARTGKSKKRHFLIYNNPDRGVNEKDLIDEKKRTGPPRWATHKTGCEQKKRGLRFQKGRGRRKNKGCFIAPPASFVRVDQRIPGPSRSEWQEDRVFHRDGARYTWG